MATRPIFTPCTTGPLLVEEVSLEFDWHPGFAVGQFRKSIASLHAAADRQGLGPILEISSKSPDEVGVALSAFNLDVDLEGRKVSVESAFQGSKVFAHGGPYQDLYARPGRDANRDVRLRDSGSLVGFRLGVEAWPIRPMTVFYDYLYLAGLSRRPELARRLLDYRAFSDIVFNPARSVNCQARAAALYVALAGRELLERCAEDPTYYRSIVEKDT